MFKVRMFTLSSVAVIFAATQVLAATSNNSSVVTPTQQTQVSAAIETVAPAKNPIKLTYVAESSAKMASANQSLDGNVSSVQHVGIGYKLDADRGLQFRQYFTYNTTDASKTDEWSIGMHMFRYTDAKLFATEALPIATDFRFFIGGSEYERDIGLLMFRNDSAVTYKVGKLDLDYGLSTRVSAYTKEQAGQTALRLIPNVYATYNLSKAASPFVGVYTDHRWNNTGTQLIRPGAKKASNPDDNSDALNIDVGFYLTLGKNVSLNPYLSTSTDLRTSYSAKDNGMFDQDNTSYMLDLSVSM